MSGDSGEGEDKRPEEVEICSSMVETCSSMVEEVREKEEEEICSSRVVVGTCSSKDHGVVTFQVGEETCSSMGVVVMVKVVVGTCSSKDHREVTF